MSEQHWCGAAMKACFTCGAGPGSATLRVVSLDHECLTTCSRPDCQHHALTCLRESEESRT